MSEYALHLTFTFSVPGPNEANDVLGDLQAHVQTEHDALVTFAEVEEL